MKIDEVILEKMVKRVKTSLLSFHSHRKKARKYVRWFINGMTDTDREFIIKEILHQQNRSIENAIELKKNIAIPMLGSFQYRESLEISKEISKEVKAEMGVTDLRKVDEETFIKVNDEVNKRKKSILLPLYFKQLNIKGSTVDHQFLKKIKK